MDGPAFVRPAGNGPKGETGTTVKNQKTGGFLRPEGALIPLPQDAVQHRMGVEVHNTSKEIRSVAGGLIRISAVCMPMYAYENVCYFTLRSGGKTFITFLFDSCFCWVCSIPVAYFLAHFTGMPILPMFACVQLVEIIKCVVGWRMTASGRWAQNLVAD